MGEKGIEALKKLGYGCEDITYDLFKWKNPNIKSQGKIKCGKKTCRFVQPLDGSKCIIPNILKKLLAARKKTRKKIHIWCETDPGNEFGDPKSNGACKISARTA